MKFFVRSLLVLFLLYGLLFAAGDLWLERLQAPVWVAMAFAAATVLLQYAYAPRLIEWMMEIRWDDDGRALPVRNREFLQKLCTARNLKFPRIGIIDSGTPNAFTYGHLPRDARLVVTSGLLRILDPEEINAVLAHEMGHVAHWDIVVMTLAALVPLLLYQFYRFALRGSGNSGDGDPNKKIPPGVAEGAYLAYLVSEFLVLLLSRTREYFADRFSAEVTGNPDALACALVKISYGMVRADGELQHAMDDAVGQQRARLDWQHQEVCSMALLGICNLRGGRTLALSEASGAGATALLRWDLVNPWARVYQLASTHPLTALRIRALNREAETRHQPVSHPLPAGEPLRWAEFPLEALLWAAPWMGFAVLIALRAFVPKPVVFAPSLVVFTGVAWALRIWFRYYGAPRPATIRELMEDVTVSEMRPRAVRLEGTIVGFGVPGAFWCPDLVLRDSTGLVYVLYRQWIPFARLFFALSSAQQYIGQKVVVEGWFRRGFQPYLEMSSLSKGDGRPHRAYSRWIQYGAAAMVAAFGLFLFAKAH